MMTVKDMTECEFPSALNPSCLMAQTIFRDCLMFWVQDPSDLLLIHSASNTVLP